MEEALAAGLVARAQGLEPAPYAHELAARVIAGEITLQGMEGALLARYREEDRVRNAKA